MTSAPRSCTAPRIPSIAALTMGMRVRVIMVTALDDVLDKRTAIESGADDFLEKPLDFKKLALSVRRNLATLAARVA